MPAYPFSPMPTLGEFIRQACDEFDAKLTNADITIQGPEGIFTPEVLERNIANKKLKVVLPYLDETDRLTPHQVLSLCRRLQIDSSIFGLNLTDLGLNE